MSRLLLGFIVAVVCTPAGVSGAFLLLPIQIQILGVPSPTVSATNLLFNVVATSAGATAYARHGAIDGPLLRRLLAGAVPGMVVGALLRSTWFADEAVFAWPAAGVLVIVGVRLLADVVPRSPTPPLRRDLPAPGRIAAIGAAAGVIGGVYGIGGAALAVPWLVGVERLPVTRVAGAAMVVTLTTSTIGLGTFVAGDAFGFGQASAPNWVGGLALGLGGAIGAVVGAGLQQHVPVRLLRVVLGLAAVSAGVRMVL
ncbi:MAG: sulfite exporter TauE/SafE family protein [Ilumatobacteraceae bacterium]